jgi:hypothetical protein
MDNSVARWCGSTSLYTLSHQKELECLLSGNIFCDKCARRNVSDLLLGTVSALLFPCRLSEKLVTNALVNQYHGK